MLTAASWVDAKGEGRKEGYVQRVLSRNLQDLSLENVVSRESKLDTHSYSTFMAAALLSSQLGIVHICTAT
jgi:hypothetical protein